MIAGIVQHRTSYSTQKLVDEANKEIRDFLGVLEDGTADYAALEPSSTEKARTPSEICSLLRLMLFTKSEIDVRVSASQVLV